MEIYELPFGQIKILQKDIAEVIINEGIQMDKAILEKYHHFLLTHLEAPFSLLINKINNYSYDAYVQEHLATLKEINVMAVVSYKTSTTAITEELVNFPRIKKWKLMIFSDREKALSWLQQEQDYVHLQKINQKYSHTRE